MSQCKYHIQKWCDEATTGENDDAKKAPVINPPGNIHTVALKVHFRDLTDKI